jgi:hypothetical protein
MTLGEMVIKALGVITMLVMALVLTVSEASLSGLKVSIP